MNINSMTKFNIIRRGVRAIIKIAKLRIASLEASIVMNAKIDDMLPIRIR